MPSNDGVTEPTVRDYSYVSCSLVMFEGGGGGGDGGGGGSGDNSYANDSMSAGGGSNGSDFDDDSSWTEDTVSYAGTSSSDSSSSGSTGDGYKVGTKETELMHDVGGNRGKWLKSLWTIIDRLDGGEQKRGGRKPSGKPRPPPVKTILRPPTTYKYVIGMSGFPSKVAIYPRRM